MQMAGESLSHEGQAPWMRHHVQGHNLREQGGAGSRSPSRQGQQFLRAGEPLKTNDWVCT